MSLIKRASNARASHVDELLTIAVEVARALPVRSLVRWLRLRDLRGGRCFTVMERVIQFENIGLRYGADAEVLRDINFSLSAGGFYFLTGASGAGKTSLLKLLYLAQRPTRGVLRLFGEDVVMMHRGRLPGFRRRIGVVFQDFRLVPHLSAFDNIALPLRVAGIEEKDIAGPVEEMLAWVGLGGREGALPASLSGGEQQRIAIARAVIGRPDILVADEPTGNVDAEMAKRLIALFEALNRLGTTIVIATHDLPLIGQIAHAQMMRLDKGRLIDPTGALRFPPASPARDDRAGLPLGKPQ